MGTRKCSISPLSIARQSAADSSRSAGVLAISRPFAHALHHVPRSPHPLQPSGHVSRRLDLANQVDRSHVDPQLERRCRHDRRELAPLECLFGRSPLVQADAAVVGPERTCNDFLEFAGRGRLGLFQIVWRGQAR